MGGWADGGGFGQVAADGIDEVEPIDEHGDVGGDAGALVAPLFFGPGDGGEDDDGGTGTGDFVGALGGAICWGGDDDVAGLYGGVVDFAGGDFPKAGGTFEACDERAPERAVGGDDVDSSALHAMSFGKGGGAGRGPNGSMATGRGARIVVSGKECGTMPVNGDCC